MNTPKEANEDLRNRLTADQYYVTQEAGTDCLLYTSDAADE